MRHFTILPLPFVTILSGRWSQLWVRCGTLNTSYVWRVKRSWAAQTSLRGMGGHTVTKTTTSSSPLVVPTARGPFCMWEKKHLSVTASFCYLPYERKKQNEVSELCVLSVFQNILTALDQTWHPEHFFCSCCGGLFGSEGLGEAYAGISLPLKNLGLQTVGNNLIH